MAMTRHDRIGLPPLMLASNILVWISAVIVMGILSFTMLNLADVFHILIDQLYNMLT